MPVDLQKPTLAPARGDGRPLYYRLPENPTLRVACARCEQTLPGVRWNHANAVWCDPANSPFGDGSVHTICIHHLPDDAVIYNPVNNECRDKNGALLSS